MNIRHINILRKKIIKILNLKCIKNKQKIRKLKKNWVGTIKINI